MDTKSSPQQIASALINSIKSPNTVVHYEPIYRDVSSVRRGGTYHLLSRDNGGIKRIATVERFVKPGDTMWDCVLCIKDGRGNPTDFAVRFAISDVPSPLNRFNGILAVDNGYGRQIMRWLNRKLLWQHDNGRAILARKLYRAADAYTCGCLSPIWTQRDRIR